MSTTALRASTLFGALIVSATALSQAIDVTVDGRRIDFPNIQPQMREGRVLVPLRGVFEHMGATVRWHPENRMVTANDGDTEVRLTINSRTAYINDRLYTLDVPARIINGSTVVPLRFLSESLGAQVEWHADDRLVAINTRGGTGVVNTGETMRNAYVFEAGTVIPVTLNQRLSSAEARENDRVVATLQGNQYANLPAGTTVIGRVVAAHAQSGDNPGVLELEFNRIRMPDGTTARINGSLFSLDADAVERISDGTLVARSDRKDQRMIFAGYGAAGGLLVGLLTKRPIEGTLLGGLLGYLYGEHQRSNQRPSNVVLERGTAFGVRLDNDVRITR